MKKILLTFCFLFCTLLTWAQKPLRIGYLNRTELIASLPETAVAKTQLDSLRVQYQREAEYNEQSFRRQFAEYLQIQKKLNETLLLKRQSELQAAMERALAFRKEAEKLLVQAEAALFRPIHERVDAAIRVVGAERGYLMVVNTDNNSHPYLQDQNCEDVTTFVKGLLTTNMVSHQ